jgi:hypothetical protein
VARRDFRARPLRLKVGFGHCGYRGEVHRNAAAPAPSPQAVAAQPRKCWWT